MTSLPPELSPSRTLLLSSNTTLPAISDEWWRLSRMLPLLLLFLSHLSFTSSFSFQTLVQCTSNGSTVLPVSHPTPPSCIIGVDDLQMLHQTCSLGIYSCCPSNSSLLGSGVAQPFVHQDGHKRKFVCFTLKLAPLRR